MQHARNAIDPSVDSCRLRIACDAPCTQRSSTSERTPETSDQKTNRTEKERTRRRNCIYSLSVCKAQKCFFPFKSGEKISCRDSRANSLSASWFTLVGCLPIMCSDRNEKLLLVLITVYSCLTLPFDFSSGFHCAHRHWGPVLLASGTCIIFSRMHIARTHTHGQTLAWTLLSASRHIRSDYSAFLCCRSTFAQFHEW